MQRRGGHVYAVSVDSPTESKRIVEKFALPFPVLADESRDVISKYGIVHVGGSPEGGDIAVPMLLLIGRDGRVLWERVAPNVMDRPDPAETLIAIRAALGP